MSKRNLFGDAGPGIVALFVAVAIVGFLVGKSSGDRESATASIISPAQAAGKIFEDMEYLGAFSHSDPGVYGASVWRNKRDGTMCYIGHNKMSCVK